MNTGIELGANHSEEFISGPEKGVYGRIHEQPAGMTLSTFNPRYGTSPALLDISHCGITIDTGREKSWPRYSEEFISGTEVGRANMDAGDVSWPSHPKECLPEMEFGRVDENHRREPAVQDNLQKN